MHAGIEEFDFESAVFDCTFLAYQLIEAVALDCAGSAGVGVAAVIIPRGCSVERDFEADGFAVFRGAEDQVQVARVKAEDNFSWC